MAEDAQKDFFVSYNKADRAWAEWIAWQLEAEGYTTVLQAWDFRPGSNFVLEMQAATRIAKRTIAVLSPDYLTSLYTQPEWAAAFAKDPTGKDGTLLPVRVRACELTGLLSDIIYLDLRFCAFLHPDEIPEALLAQETVIMSPHFRELTNDPLKRDEAIGELLNYSLIQRLTETKALAIHRLVQAVLIDDLQRLAKSLSPC